MIELRKGKLQVLCDKKVDLCREIAAAEAANDKGTEYALKKQLVTVEKNIATMTDDLAIHEEELRSATVPKPEPKPEPTPEPEPEPLPQQEVVPNPWSPKIHLSQPSNDCESFNLTNGSLQPSNDEDMSMEVDPPTPTAPSNDDMMMADLMQQVSNINIGCSTPSVAPGIVGNQRVVAPGAQSGQH